MWRKGIVVNSSRPPGATLSLILHISLPQTRGADPDSGYFVWTQMRINVYKKAWIWSEHPDSKWGYLHFLWIKRSKELVGQIDPSASPPPSPVGLSRIYPVKIRVKKEIKIEFYQAYSGLLFDGRICILIFFMVVSVFGDDVSPRSDPG